MLFTCKWVVSEPALCPDVFKTNLGRDQTWQPVIRGRETEGGLDAWREGMTQREKLQSHCDVGRVACRQDVFYLPFLLLLKFVTM